MKLIHTDVNGDEHDVAVGFCFGHEPDELEVIYMPKPHKASSQGKVTIKNVNTGSEGIPYYASVYDMEWIEREDRGWVHPEVELTRVLNLLKTLNYGDMSGNNLDDVTDTVMGLTMGECMNIDPDDTKFLHDWGHKQPLEIPAFLRRQSD